MRDLKEQLVFILTERLGELEAVVAAGFPVGDRIETVRNALQELLNISGALRGTESLALFETLLH